MALTGLTLDTGALVALEKQEKRMRTVLERAHGLGLPVTVPAAVLAEWWRGGRGRQRLIVESVEIEATAESLAKLAGEGRSAAMQAAPHVRPGPSAVDAIVMASAALRGDIVYTSDCEDLELLRASYFQGVPRVLRV